MRFRGTNQTWSRDHQGNTEAIPAFITKIGTPAAGRPGRLDRFRIVLPSGVSGFDHRTINWTSLYQRGRDVGRRRGEDAQCHHSGADGEHRSGVGPECGNDRGLARLGSNRRGSVGELPAVSTKLSVGVPTTGPAICSPGRSMRSDSCRCRRGSAPRAWPPPRGAGLHCGGDQHSALPRRPGEPAQSPAEPNYQRRLLSRGHEDPRQQLHGHDAGRRRGRDDRRRAHRLRQLRSGGGTITVAQGGRGILGTQARAHGAYETAIFLHAIVASQLSGALLGGHLGDRGGGSQQIPAVRHRAGRRRVDALHAQHRCPPRDARVRRRKLGNGAARRDGVYSAVRRGNGLFRGRYGTVANAHSVGHLVFRFPYRYWDRWVIGSDAPELFYIQCDEEAQAAFWRRVFWKEELPLQGVTIECLVRLDGRARWSAQPNKTEGLWLFTSPNSGNDMKDGGGDGNSDPAPRRAAGIAFRRALRQRRLRSHRQSQHQRSPSLRRVESDSAPARDRGRAFCWESDSLKEERR